MQFPKGQFWPSFLAVFLTLLLAIGVGIALTPLISVLVVGLGLADIAIANSFTLSDWEVFIGRNQLPSARTSFKEYAEQLAERRQQQEFTYDRKHSGFVGKFVDKIKNEYDEAEKLGLESRQLLSQIQASRPSLPEGGDRYLYSLWRGLREFNDYDRELSELVKQTESGFQKYFRQADYYYAAMLKEIAAIPQDLAELGRITKATHELYTPMLSKIQDRNLYEIIARHDQAFQRVSTRLQATPQLHQVIALEDERDRLEKDKDFIETNQIRLEKELTAAQHHSTAFKALESLQNFAPAIETARQEFNQTATEFDLGHLRPSLETLFSDFTKTASRFTAGGLTLDELNDLGEQAVQLPVQLTACQQQVNASATDLQKKTLALKASLKNRLDYLQNRVSLKDEPAVQAVTKVMAQPDPALTGWPNPQTALAVALTKIRSWATFYQLLQTSSAGLQEQIEKELLPDLQRLSNLRKQIRSGYETLRNTWELANLSEALHKEVEQLAEQRQQWENALDRLRQEGTNLTLVRGEIINLLKIGDVFSREAGQVQRLVSLEKRAALLEAEVTRLTTTNEQQASRSKTLEQKLSESEAREQEQKVKIANLQFEVSQSRSALRQQGNQIAAYQNKASPREDSSTSTFESRPAKASNKLINRN